MEPIRAIATIPIAAATGAAVTFGVTSYEHDHPKSPALLATTGLIGTAFIGGIIASTRVRDDWTALALFGGGTGLLAGHGFGLGVTMALGQARGKAETKLGAPPTTW